MSHRHAIEIALGGARYQATYLDWGTGPVLLCLHGFMGNKANWLAVMKRLATRYRCVSVDLLGFGETKRLDPGPTATDYSIALEVTFVAAIARSLHLGPCALAGHSFGGWVAAAYALEYPGAVTACILVAPVGMQGDGFGDRPGPLWPTLRRSPITNSRPGALARWDAEKLDTVAGNLQVPTLVFAGENDTVVPSSCPQAYAAVIPKARLQVIPGAGHALPLERAAELATAMAAFLS